MAKVTLRAGAEIDLLSHEEMRQALTEHAGRLLKAIADPETLSIVETATTDSSGNLAPAGQIVPLLKVPVGMIAIVHRINVEAAGHTRAAPLAPGYINFCADTTEASAVLVGLPADGTTTSAPASIVDSLSAAAVLKSGQTFGAYGASLAASTLFTFRMQYVLKETQR